MKKEILFVTTNMHIDGANISLINLMKSLNYEKYSVSLGLFSVEGKLLTEVPKKVNIFLLNSLLEDLTSPMKISMQLLARKQRYILMVHKFFFSLKMNINYKVGTYLNFWKKINKSIVPLSKEYDAVIAFQDNLPRYYVIDKTKSKKKILWNHTMLKDINSNEETEYFNKACACVAVSDSARLDLQNRLGDLTTTCYTIENIIFKNRIIEKSKEFIPFVRDNNTVNIVTVARLSFVKGVDFIPKACKIIESHGIAVKWYIIGEGPEFSLIHDKIKQLSLQEHISMLGEITNPYPYILNCDYYVQPSRVEAKSIAVEEAKILKKVVICTDYPTVNSQIKNDLNGYIVSMDSESIARKIIELANKKSSDYTCTVNLEDVKGNEDEVRKLYSIID